MTLPRSAADVLADHVTLEVECIDRMYLNVYQPRLQFVEGVVSFLRKHRGYPIASSALLEPISREFVADIHRFAQERGVAMVDFAKGQRKDDLAHEFLAEFDQPEGVLFIGRPQERTRVFRTEKRRNPITGATYPWIVAATAMVNHFYVYAVDADFGPFFIKFCTYFPAPRGALIYPPRSGVGLEVISQGAMADLDSKEEGDNSMPSEPALVPRRMGRGVGGPA